MVLALFGRFYTLIKVGCAQFILADYLLSIKAPGDNRVTVGLDGQQIIDIAAFGQQHQKAVGKAGEKWNQYFRQAGYVVECETVEHLAHIETNLAVRVSHGFSYLPEHGIVIDIVFYKWGVFAIDKRQIAICAVVWTAVRDRNQFVVRATADIRAKPAIKIPYKR